ncbi:hypothetical protein VNO77_19392 [Canavalia gladiata]|uniref:Uncharacterized protein n=1 Tax=Canavalia gladiata TaxID=3824 RepID=A0AAN9LMN8_CANGL
MQLARVGLQNGDMVHGDSNPLLGDGYSVLTIRQTLLLSANATRCNVKDEHQLISNHYGHMCPFWMHGCLVFPSGQAIHCLIASNKISTLLIIQAGSLSFGNEWCSMLGHTSQFECEDPECLIGPVYAGEKGASASVCLCSLILWAIAFTFRAFGLLKIEDGLVDDESLSPLLMDPPCCARLVEMERSH